MSLLSNTPSTLEQRQASAAQQIATAARTNFNTLCVMQREGLNLVWANRLGLTPQQVCDALGTNAATAFAMHAALTDAIAVIAAIGGGAPAISHPTHEFTINPDGTVTVGSGPYTPPAP